MRVLDLDMDYFMTEIASTPFYCEERLDEEYYGDSVWTEEEVRQFFEKNLVKLLVKCNFIAFFVNPLTEIL